MHELAERVAEAFHTLPARYLGAEPGLDATYHIRLGDIGRSWEVRCTTAGARVRAGATRREPDVVIGTDAETWLALRAGELSGVEAFSRRRLYARGDLDLAVGFEGLFRLPSGRPPLLKMHHVPVGKLKISTLTMGRGPDMLLLHGLGATKASFFDTAAALSRTYRVHAIDLPGFGSSSKPALASYDAGFFSDAVLGVMDAMEIERAHVVGNSLGGPQRLSGAALRPRRVLPAAGRAAAPGAVRLGHARQADPCRLRPARRRVAARSRADRARRLRPRPPGGAAGPDQRAARALLRPRRRAAAGRGAGPRRGGLTAGTRLLRS